MRVKLTPSVHIVILNWNGWRQTVECLESLKRLDYPDCQVVVVDNGSRDDSVERLSEWAGKQFLTGPRFSDYNGFKTVKVASYESGSARAALRRLHLIRAGENLGFAAGCNLGADFALSRGTEYVWLLNNDAVVSPETLSELVSCSARGSFPVAGSLVLDGANAPEPEFAQGELPRDLFGLCTKRSVIPGDKEFWRTDWVTFASVLISADVINRRIAADGHFLDPRFFMYVEDIDFCFYCRAQGINIGVSAAGQVRHKTSSSSGGKGSPLVYYYITRNRLFVTRRWLAPHLYALFVAYYIPSRLVLQLRHIASGRFSEARAVFDGIYDYFRDRQGQWDRHIR